MPMSVVNFFERIPQIREGESADGRSHLENGRGRSDNKKHGEKHRHADAELQAYSSRMTGMPRRTMCDGSSTFHFVIRSARKMPPNGWTKVSNYLATLSLASVFGRVYGSFPGRARK